MLTVKTAIKLQSHKFGVVINQE